MALESQLNSSPECVSPINALMRTQAPKAENHFLSSNKLITFKGN